MGSKVGLFFSFLSKFSILDKIPTHKNFTFNIKILLDSVTYKKNLIYHNGVYDTVSS